MDGANRRFMEGKEKWLSNHLIVYNVRGGAESNPFQQQLGTTNSELPTVQFDLRKIGSIHKEGGGDGKEYALTLNTDYVGGVERKITSKTNFIRCYFLPWGSKKTFSGRLGTAADFFFTPTLNGCTFAHSGDGPAPSVAHANAVDVHGMISQTNMDTSLNAAFGGSGPLKTLIKTNYKRTPVGGEDYRATVIGIRKGNSWSFYYQNYMVTSGGGKYINTGLGLCVKI